MWVIKMWKIDFRELGGLDFLNQIAEWYFLHNKFHHVSISFIFSPESETMIYRVVLISSRIHCSMWPTLAFPRRINISIHSHVVHT